MADQGGAKTKRNEEKPETVRGQVFDVGPRYVTLNYIGEGAYGMVWYVFHACYNEYDPGQGLCTQHSLAMLVTAGCIFCVGDCDCECDVMPC